MARIVLHPSRSPGPPWPARLPGAAEVNRSVSGYALGDLETTYW